MSAAIIISTKQRSATEGVHLNGSLLNRRQEWFYQYKGGMLLRVVEDNQFRDVRIEEGEMFLLPGKK